MTVREPVRISRKITCLTTAAMRRHMTMPADDNPNVTNELLPLIYDELRGVARRFFRDQRPDFTLCPTELVNEACLHLLRYAPGPWDSPEHFRAIATHKIWQVVIDHLKRRRTVKRGGRRIIPGASGDECANAVDEKRADAPSVAHDKNKSAGKPESRATDAANTPAAVPEAHRSGAKGERWSRVPLEIVQVEWHDRKVELLDLAEAMEALKERHGRAAEVVMLHWFGGLKYADAARLLDVSVSTVEKDFRFALAWLNRRLTSNT